MHATPRQIRWALLLTTVTMASLLLSTGLWSYTSARDSAQSLVQSQTVGAAMAVRRALRVAGSYDGTSLQEILADTRSDGVSYLAILDMVNSVVAKAGKPAPASTWVKSERIPIGPNRQIVDRSDFQIRFIVPILEGHGRGQRGMGPGPGMGTRNFRRDMVDHRLLIELQSPAAEVLFSRARLSLLTNSTATIVLFLLAAIFWRLSLRAEATEAQLAHDRQLKTLGQMSAVLGHELRNPLTSLKGHAQLLLEKLPADHPGRRGAETILRETIRLEELAKHVLEFARKGNVTLAAVDPVALAKSVVENTGIDRIELAIEGPSQPVLLDQARIEAVLVNLLRNATEASPDGQPILLSMALRPNHDIRFEVRDRGEGIPVGEEERIFEPFYTRRTKGTGLGLALARQIVEGHGGTIVAQNHPDGGALVRVTLPWRTPSQNQGTEV